MPNRLAVDGLLVWSRRNRRDLPWRRTTDPWHVLVSETMLQQTQVARVEPVYTAFVERFPTPTTCADAAAGQIVEAWAGLGYNRRAVNLHGAATVIRDAHGGRVPDRLEALLALPGVGPYTARAVLAFAFGRDYGVLDTNVARVLARAFSGRRLARREAQALADRLVPAGRAWEWNQGMLDLGATVCRKRAPRCAACPLQAVCQWATAGHPAPDPAENTAGASTPQATFEGSDRQGRGRLVDALRTGPVPLARVADVAGWPDEPGRAQRVAEELLAEGMAEEIDGMLSLPS